MRGHCTCSGTMSSTSGGGPRRSLRVARHRARDVSDVHGRLLHRAQRRGRRAAAAQCSRERRDLSLDRLVELLKPDHQRRDSGSQIIESVRGGRCRRQRLTANVGGASTVREIAALPPRFSMVR
jgi:hypothetical protein